MALIKCPECGKEISEKANCCPYCGCPSDEWNKNDNECEKTDIDLIIDDIKAKYDSTQTVKMIKELRERTGMDLPSAKSAIENSISKKSSFNGIYKYTLFNGKQEVYCPRCHSENCSHYAEQKIIPGKTKTRYTANLNPLKPFTLVNKKDKIIKEEQLITENKIICNDCGYIFK